MARILLAWEFGGGFGHATNLAAIATELGARGHACVLAAREPATARTVLPDLADIRPAPKLDFPADRRVDAGNLGDIVANLGFIDGDHTRRVLAGWDALVAAVAPDAIVADTAIGLQLAVRGRPIPTVAVGNGFTVAPPVDELPPFVEGRAPTIPQADLVRAINAVLVGRGSPPVGRLADVFEADATFVTTLPELDRYSALRAPESRCGPLQPLPAPTTAAPVVDYFAYLAFGRRAATLLAGLALSGLRGSAYVRGAPADAVELFRSRGITMHDAPRDLAEEAGRAALLIHHGGTGTLELGMAVGRPQVLLPRHLEQSQNAEAAARLRTAAHFPRTGELTRDGVARGVRKVREDPRYAVAAQAWALSYAERRPAAGLKIVADRIEALAAAGR